MEILDNYLPKDLINIVEEYEKTDFDKVIYEYHQILNKTFMILKMFNEPEIVYKYPSNYDVVFSDECEIRYGKKSYIYSQIIKGLIMKINEHKVLMCILKQ
jgi:hypothetical protein